MAKGKNGSSGGQYDHSDLPTFPSTKTPGNRKNDSTPDSEGYIHRSGFTIEPIHRYSGDSAEDAIKKTYNRD